MKTLEVSNEIHENSPRSPSAARPPTWLVASAFGAVYLIWGSTYVGIRLAIDSIPPLSMSGGRFLLAGLILYPVMRLCGAPRPQAIHWRNAAVVGALLLLVGNGGVSWAQQRVPTNMTALIIAGTPLWILLIDWLRPRGTRPRAIVFAGLALGLVGVGLIVSSRDQAGHNVIDPAGGAVLVLASVCWAAGSVFSRHAVQSASALLNVAMQMLSGGVLLAIGAALTGELATFEMSKITSASAGAFIYLTLFGSLVGFTAYIWLLGVSTPAKVATYAYVNPLIAVLLGWLVLGEALPRSVLVAGGLIIAAVVLITASSQREATRTSRTEREPTLQR